MVRSMSWLLLSLSTLIGAVIYDEDSIQIYTPPTSPFSRYFGYSILFRRDPFRLLVGAPQWKGESSFYSGAVFDCLLNPTGQKENVCSQSSYEIPESTGLPEYPDFTRHNDVGLGSSLAEVSGNTLVMCGPRWSHVNSHDSDIVQMVHGVCLATNTQNKYLGPFNIVSPSSADKQYENVPETNSSISYFANAQAGFSVTATPDSKMLLIGAPGLRYFTGGLARYSAEKLEDANKFKLLEEVVFKEMQIDSYLGYSVDTAVFEPEKGEILGISGAPRGTNLNGTVLIFPISKDIERVKTEDIRVNLTGSQTWEYFGASVLAVDLDGDGRNDLIVGAPQHAFSASPECCFDQGVVYVYLNKKTENGFTLELAHTVKGSSANNAQFGSSLADLGDVDGDGYTDVAIGAPFETGSGGRLGAVYIFRGDRGGLKAEYSQKLLPTTAKHNGFGFSLTKAVDLDENGCKDLAVGAVLGNAVATFRCSPTLTVTAFIKTTGKKFVSCNEVTVLPKQTTKVTLDACFNVSETKQEWKNVHLSVTSTILVNNEPYSTKDLAIIPGQSYTCETIHISREENRKEVKVHFHLAEVANSGPFDKQRARLSDNSVLNSSLTASFVDCGSDQTCDPELIVKHSVFNATYIPGTNASLGFNMELENIGEAAFGTRLVITIPSETQIKNTFGECKIEKNVVDCNFKYFSKEDGRKDWSIKLDHTPVLAAGPLNFSYTLYNCQSVVKQSQFTIDVKLNANIMIGGRKSPDALYVSQADVSNNASMQFNHSFYIINHGPSGYPNVTVSIQLPEGYLDVIPSGCLLQKGAESSVLLCVYQLPASLRKATTVELPFTLHTKLQESFLYSGKNLTTTATLIYGEQNRTAQIITQLVMEPYQGAPILYIVLAVIAGLIIIAVIVYVMYRMNFFRRFERERLKKLNDSVWFLQAKSARS